MARQRSEFLGSLGKLFAIFKMIADSVLEIGGSDEDIAKINGNGRLAKDIANVICGKAKVVTLEEEKKDEPYEKLLSTILSVESLNLAALPGDSRSILIGELCRALRSISYREREIIRLRYGLDDGYPYTLEEIARIFKVTRERIRQIEAQTIRKLMHENRSAAILKEYKRATWRFGPNACYQEEVSVEEVSAEEMLAKPIAALSNLSIRAKKTLAHIGVKTIGDLSGVSEADLRSCHLCEDFTVSEIRDRLGRNGLKLRGDE